MGIRLVCWRASIALSCLLLVGSTASAQNGNRQELFENLLRSLIESRMDDSHQTNQYYNLPQEARPVNQDQELRANLKSFSDEMNRLFDTLSNDMRRNPTIRNFLNSTLEVQASATVLLRLIDQRTDFAILRSEYSTLDQEWRLLSHKLQTTIGMSAPSLASVAKLDGLNSRMSQIFDVKPQVDEREFLRLTDALQLDLRNLNEDIAIELARTPQVRQLLVQGRLIEQQVRFMATAIETSKNREQAVTEFNKFHELWGPFAAQLWPLNNRYLERSLQRIEQTDRQLHEVLWLDKTLDTRQLQRLTSVLTADLDMLFKTTTLYSLMSMQNRDVLLRAATDLNIANKKLADSLAANKQLAQLQAEFRALDQSWHQVETAYKGCEEPEILRLLRSSSQTMLSIQNALQLEDAFDRDTAVQILASLENYGEHMQESFSTLVLPNQQYSRRFSIQGLHTAQQFTAFTRNIHYDLAEGVEPEELRARCDTLVRGWKYLNEEFIQKLNGSEREQLSRLSAQITPLMVQLQTMFDV